MFQYEIQMMLNMMSKCGRNEIQMMLNMMSKLDQNDVENDAKVCIYIHIWDIVCVYIYIYTHVVMQLQGAPIRRNSNLL